MSTLTAVAEERITLRHGAGGRAMRALIEDVFLVDAATASPRDVGPEAMDDGAALWIGDRWIVVTTDSHVVHPVFFPGGDIGRLAVCGTVNDLAMMGATEVLGLTCGVILEEGFLRGDLERIQAAMAEACREAGARIVTGDTKVMGKGEIDGIVLNTAGVAATGRVVRDRGLRVGDRIIVTGAVGDHGLAILAARHGLRLEGDLVSDVAPLNGLVRAALAAGGDRVVAMKDPTRGGLSSALHEMAQKSGVGIVLEEASVPVHEPVRAAADLLGIDPLHVANEGKAVIGVSADAADAVLAALHAHPLGREAAVVARCISERPGNVILDTGFGKRLLAEPEGELLPRIC
jgi:hydrogenase expression/formation protein HypE